LVVESIMTHISLGAFSAEHLQTLRPERWSDVGGKLVYFGEEPN
jgi:hypothetical protein